MELLIPVDFFKTLMSESGMVASLLAIAVMYQTRQLGKAREKIDGLHGQILQLATAQIRAMTEVQNVLEKVVDLTPAVKE